MKPETKGALKAYLRRTFVGVWGLLVLLVTFLGLVSLYFPAHLAKAAELPSLVYWAVAVFCLAVAPFWAYQEIWSKADRCERICRQALGETRVFIDYGRHFERADPRAVKEGLDLLESISDEVVNRGDLSRAGLLVPLFHALKNPTIDALGTGSEAYPRLVLLAREAVEVAIQKGFPPRPITEEMQSKPWEEYWRCVRPGKSR